jgi:hypothetical protein
MNFIYENLFTISIVMLYILYFLIVFNIYEKSTLRLQEHLDNLKFFLKVFVCSILIIRFNPLFDKSKFTHFDRRLVFSASLFLLSSTTLTDYVGYKDYITYQLKNALQTIKFTY